MKSIFIAAMIAFAGVVHAEELSIFGLPLGGRLDSAVRNCPSDLTKQPQLCWLGKPFRSSSGALLGGASISDKDLPSWASGHFPDVQVSKGGFLHSIIYSNNNRMFKDREKIVEAVRSRFGSPSVIEYRGTYSAKWENIPGRIEFACTQGNCYFDILSKSAVDELKKEKLKREIELKSRPSTL